MTSTYIFGSVKHEFLLLYTNVLAQICNPLGYCFYYSYFISRAFSPQVYN